LLCLDASVRVGLRILVSAGTQATKTMLLSSQVARLRQGPDGSSLRSGFRGDRSGAELIRRPPGRRSQSGRCYCTCQWRDGVDARAAKRLRVGEIEPCVWRLSRVSVPLARDEDCSYTVEAVP